MRRPVPCHNPVGRSPRRGDTTLGKPVTIWTFLAQLPFAAENSSRGAELSLLRIGETMDCASQHLGGRDAIPLGKALKHFEFLGK